jgi:2-oxoisovalerate dehydrogenase E1 component
MFLFVREKFQNGSQEWSSISVGVTAVLDSDEYILPAQKFGSIYWKRFPLYRLFSQWQGKANGFTKVGS